MISENRFPNGQPAATPDGRSGFTLIELLSVIAIMSVLISLVAVAFQNIGRGHELTNSASMVVDQLNLARQTAQTQNRQIEVRFYEIPSKSSPDLSFRALRLLQYNSSASTTSALKDLGPIQFLAESIVIKTDPTYSNLFASPPQAAPLGTDLLPGSTINRRYIKFVFRADGSTDLPFTEPIYFLTLLDDKLPKTGPDNQLPANFITVQVDPSTGRAKFVRP